MDTTLSTRQWLRFATFTAFYFAQGIPIGLFSVAIPAFLAADGATVKELGIYAGTISLPWAWKFLVGPFMDRFTFLPMGFRRPWVILAQTGLVCSLVSLGLYSFGGDPSILALTVFGFVCNVFSASQDVATDGMAIDILHENERGRANAFMACGQTLGFSAFGALSGFLLVAFDMRTVAFVAALTIALIWLWAVVVRERPGERKLPWTEGSAAHVEHRREASLFENLWDLLRTFVLPMSLVLVVMEFLNRANDGIAIALFPAYATQVLGFEPQVYTAFASAVGIVAALVGIAFGPFIDRFGAKRVLILVLLLGAALRFWAWIGVTYYNIATMNLVYLYVAASIVGQWIFVATIAIFMTICLKRISATQFSVYMSLANLSRSIGSFFYGHSSVHMAMHDGFLAMGILLLLSAGVTLFFFPDTHKRHLERIEQEPDY
ncbi:MAG: MFS transporter [Gammaproteobacteria bacterium]|nr:MFS transporter [Gammaproteobacteria bacterium]